MVEELAAPPLGRDTTLEPPARTPVHRREGFPSYRRAGVREAVDPRRPLHRCRGHFPAAASEGDEGRSQSARLSGHLEGRRE